jgi:crotonobetainyl-CoA:carnitine CoA-transferase CaiB-like acyl-CoA transferase
VRSGADLAAAADFARGTAVLCSPDGTPAKGIPFRLRNRPLGVQDSCHTLGADNAAVLREAGFTPDRIATLEREGVLATRPRSTA